MSKMQDQPKTQGQTLMESLEEARAVIEGFHNAQGLKRWAFDENSEMRKIGRKAIDEAIASARALLAETQTESEGKR